MLTSSIQVVLLTCFDEWTPGVRAFYSPYLGRPGNSFEPQRGALWRGYNLLVHGFNGDVYGGGAGDSCTNTQSANSMAKIANYIRGKNHNVGGGTWTGQVLTIGYYKLDNHCNVDLHQAAGSHCKNYYFSGVNGAEAGPAADGTNNESIYRLSCLFAWYIYVVNKATDRHLLR